MRFIHAADIHLDSPLRGLAGRDGAPVERLRRATREAFSRVIDLCIDREVSFLVLAGDLYDGDTPNMQIAAYLRGELLRLRERGIRVVIEKGNHDAANRITSALDLPDNTRMLSDKTPETVVFDDLDVAIHGQSFRKGPVTENLAAGYPAPIKGRLNIGVLHTSLGGSAEHDPYAPCSLDELTTRGYAYWALGHIHKAAVLAREPSWVVYPGNLQGRHARETGPKGCVLVECDGDRVLTIEPIAVDSVRWHQVEVDLLGAASEPELVERLRAALIEAQRNSDDRLCVARILLSGRTGLHDEIRRRPARLRQTVLELAAEAAGDGIWIETVRNGTTPPSARTPGPANDVAAELMALVREVVGDPTLLGPVLANELEPLRAKLPEDLKELAPLKLIDDPGLAREALSRIEPRLAALLAGDDTGEDD